MLGQALGVRGQKFENIKFVQCSPKLERVDPKLRQFNVFTFS